MRVLVGAARVDRGWTSEGLCSARMVRLLADRGHEVHLLVGQVADSEPAEVASEVRAAVGAGIDVEVVPTRSSLAAQAGWWAARRPWRFRPDLPLQVVTGQGLDELAAVRSWAAALRAAERRVAPDVTYVRGAGLDLGPLLARSGWGGPWAGHLHDPWPTSWYPPRYRSRSRVVSARQEARARSVLGAAPALTLPSARLVGWMAERSGLDLARRAHVVAHLGVPLPTEAAAPDQLAVRWPDRAFVVGHVGALLGPRDPGALLEGWRLLVEREPAAAQEVGVALLGSVDRRHVEGAGPMRRFEVLAPEGALVISRDRAPSVQARQWSAAADLAVVLESDDAISPFLPAKVADLAASRHPTIALTRAGSPTADLLGAEHPLRVEPDDPEGVAAALTLAWRAWREGALDRLRPPEAAARQVAPEVVGAALDRALEAAVRCPAPG